MATKRIKDLTNTATEADLTSSNYFAIDGSAGTKKLPAENVAKRSEQNALAIEKVDKHFAQNFYGEYKDSTDSLVTGGTIRLNVGIGNSVDLSGYTSSDYVGTHKECVKGQCFKVRGLGGSTPRLWGFTDSNGILLSVANESLDEHDYIEIYAPANGYVIVNTYKNSYRGFKEQISISSEISRLDGRFDADDVKIDKLAEDTRYYESLALYKDKNIYCAGSVGDTIDPSLRISGGWCCYIGDCIQGDVFRLSGKGGNSPRLWCFIDGNNKILSVASAGVEQQAIIDVTAPANGKFIYNSVDSVNYVNLSKLVAVQDKIDAIDEQIGKYEAFEPLADLRVNNDCVDVSDLLEGFSFAEVSDNPIMSQTYAAFDSLVESFPDLVTKSDAAELVDIEYPAYAADYKTYLYKISNTNTYAGNGSGGACEKKKLFIYAGTHGDEIAAPANLFILAWRLCNQCTQDENLFKLISAFDIYMLPCLNGYGLINNVRTNGNGVDINRNFPTSNWTESGNGTQNYSGSSAGSEFETQIIVGLVNSIKPDFTIDHHNYAGLAQQFYTTISTGEMRNIVYQLLTCCSCAFKKAYPLYFGAGYSLLKDVAGAAPVNVNRDAGRFPNWLYESGNGFGGTVEISDNINYDGGEVSLHTRDRWGSSVFSIGEYTLRAHVFLYANYALRRL